MASEGDLLDIMPSYAFWREGCRTLMANVCFTLRRAKVSVTKETVLRFIRSMPVHSAYLSDPSWTGSFCDECCKAAFEGSSSDDEEFREVVKYFFVYLLDRSLIARHMLIDSAVGILSGFDFDNSIS